MLLRPHCLSTPQTGSWRLDSCRVESQHLPDLLPLGKQTQPSGGGDCACHPHQPPAFLHPEPARGASCMCMGPGGLGWGAASTLCGVPVVAQTPPLLPSALHTHVGSTGSHVPGASGSVLPPSAVYFLPPRFGPPLLATTAHPHGFPRCNISFFIIYSLPPLSCLFFLFVKKTDFIF